MIISLPGNSQEIARKGFYFKNTLNYRSFPEDSRGRQVISLLSSNNVTSLYWVFIDVDADLLVQLNKAEYGQISANIILQNYSLEGETHFRDFQIDSLLMPDLIEGNIRIFYNDELIVSQPWLIGVRTGYVSMYIPDTIHIHNDQLRVELEVNRFDYSDELYGHFIEKTNLINAYYAFTEVLRDMLNGFEKKGLNKGERPSYLFNSWEEIQRVNNYVYKYQFYNRLNLDEHDPAGFLNLYNKSIRLQRRATTLKNWVKSIPAREVIEDKRNFCNGFADISMKYLELASDHQPYIAAGFTEVARIISSEQVKDMLIEAERLYDVFNSDEFKSTSQTISDGFVMLADSSLAKQKYVSTLDLLYNANLVAEWFEQVDRLPLYDNIYVKAIDGLMSSYLKVATMAYKSGSYYMAEMYYQKAITVYRHNSENLGGKKLASIAFLAFIREQTAFSYKLINDKEYFKAVELLLRAKAISEEQQLNQSLSLIDSAFRLSYTGIYDKKLDSIQQLIDDHRQDDALKAMEQTSAFSEQKNEYLQNMNKLQFMVLARALYDAYYSKGLSLMKGENSEKALFTFLKAKRINDKYLGEVDAELDSMIYSSTVPVILDLVKQAEFEVWANRTDKANGLLTKALDYQKKYELADNIEINSAIEGLREKIKTRYCTNLNNELFAINKQAKNRLKEDKFLEAETLLKKGINILENYPFCVLDGGDIKWMYKKNKDAFTFYGIVSDLNQNLENKDYPKAIQLFQNLVHHYKIDNIKRYGIKSPDLYQFVKSRKNEILIQAAADYFVSSGNYEIAFNYLNLLKRENLSSKETKDLQQEIGVGLAVNNEISDFTDKNLISALNGEDKWYRYMQKAYDGKPSGFLNIFTKNK